MRAPLSLSSLFTIDRLSVFLNQKPFLSEVKKNVGKLVFCLAKKKKRISIYIVISCKMRFIPDEKKWYHIKKFLMDLYDLLLRIIFFNSFSFFFSLALTLTLLLFIFDGHICCCCCSCLIITRLVTDPQQCV